MVSVIIVNYNTRRLTINCIQSVYEKTKGVAFEIILVDNASQECDALIFKELFPEIILIKSKTNLGFAGGNNLGLEQAKGEYIVLLNSDTELVNDAISLAAGLMKQDSRIGALSGKLMYPDGRIQSVAGRFPSLWNEVRELFRINRFISSATKARLFLGDHWDYTKRVEADWIWGTFFMMPAEVLTQFPGGRLHEDFFMYVEDVQWCHYLKKTLKYKVVYDPEQQVIHYLSGSTSYANAMEIFRKKILPHEYLLLIRTKGAFYTYLYYMIKAMHLFTLRKKEKMEEGMYYLRFLKNKTTYIKP